MCMLCVEIQLDKLTAIDIARNFNEMTVDSEDHWVDVLVEIEKKGLTEEVAKEMNKLTGVYVS